MWITIPEVTVEGKTYRFINGIGFGIDGYCCEEGDSQRAKSDKKINYTVIARKMTVFFINIRQTQRQPLTDAGISFPKFILSRQRAEDFTTAIL